MKRTTNIKVIPRDTKTNLNVRTFFADGQIESLPNGLSDQFPNLKRIGIHHSLHNVRSGSLNGLMELIKLNFSHNVLEQLPEKLFTDNGGLRIIILKNNSLSFLPAGLLEGLYSLGNIDLSNNKLTSLPEALFSNNFILEYIDLSHNQLTVIPANSFDGLKLKNLNLSSNDCVDLNVFDFEIEMPELLTVIKENCVTKAVN